MKFIRDYEVVIQNPEGEQFTISPPFSASIQIQRNTLASANTCNVTFYNLSERTRNRIFKDRYTITDYWQIQIRAGYRRLSNIFTGNIYESISYKQGADWITEIECFDGGFGIQNGFVSQTVQKDTSNRNIIQNVMDSFPQMLTGAIGDPGEGQSPRGKVLLGRSTDVMGDVTNGNYFIDNETVHAIGPDQVLTDSVIVLDSNQLFTTPRIRDTFLDCDILFLPEAQVGLLCELRSREARFDGQYKTMGFSHDITISSAAGGQATTTISLYKGAQGLREAT